MCLAMLSGAMPWSSEDPDVAAKIQGARFTLETSAWDGVSSDAKNFIRGLLEVDPSQRLTAPAALGHPWLKQHVSSGPSALPCPDPAILRSLRFLPSTLSFRRCSMVMAAWSLSQEELVAVQEQFLALDSSRRGVLSARDLQVALVQHFDSSGEEVARIYQMLKAFNPRGDNEIHYSDFVSATVSSHVDLSEESIRMTFRRFDRQRLGKVTVEDLKSLLGEKFWGVTMEQLVQEADIFGDGAVSYTGFRACLQGIQDQIDEIRNKLLVGDGKIVLDRSHSQQAKRNCCDGTVQSSCPVQ